TTWEETREAVEIVYKNPPRGIWVLRQMEAHARATGNHAMALAVNQQLLERTQRASEAATLSLRAADQAERAGELTDAQALLEHAVVLAPNHVVAHLSLAAVLEKQGSFAAAAAALEGAASVAASDNERAGASF